MKWESFVTADLSGSSLLLPTDHKISEIREAPAAAIHHGCTSLSPSRYAGGQYARLEETPGTEVGSRSDMV